MGSEGRLGVSSLCPTSWIACEAMTVNSRSRSRSSQAMWRTLSFGGIVMIVMAACGAGACSHGPSSATPVPSVPAGAVLPSPIPGDVTLTGHVVEAPPTSTTGVWDAVVTLDDGVSAWQSGKTIGGAGLGVYTISGLHGGRFRATVSADGFVGVTRDLTIAPDNTIDFQLLPVAVRKSLTVSSQLNDGDGTCSDGTHMAGRGARTCVDAVRKRIAGSARGLDVDRRRERTSRDESGRRRGVRAPRDLRVGQRHRDLLVERRLPKLTRRPHHDRQRNSHTVSVAEL
jgi:hypothetical protein